jgi:UDP-N-acetylmuramoyl-L-alanyl-D-glutamate--2,6-diaminopimelate ligase
MRLSELAGRIDGARLLGGGDPEILDIAYDSRKVGPGALFLALPGGHVNGADFLPAALKSGAVAVLTEAQEQLVALPQLSVPEARAAMAQAGRAFFGEPSEGLRLTAITGTNGKTTTAYLLRHILTQTVGQCGMTGTIEYDLGAGAQPAVMTTPESLDLYRYYARMADGGCQFAVSEVSSHSLTKQRVAGVCFAAAVFTNLTQDHLDYHGNMENYFRAKAVLFEGLRPESLALLNSDDPYSERLAAMTPARVMTYGVAGDADFRAEVLSLSTVGTVFKFSCSRYQAEVHMGLLGAYNVHNALAAVAVAVEMGVEPPAAVEALSNFEGVPGRLESVDCGQDFRVLVDYAHTDEALRSVLGSLGELYPRRVITVFGCGGDRDRGKRPRMGRVVEELSDVAVVTSDNPRSEEPGAIIEDILQGLQSPDAAVVEADRGVAIARAIDLAETGDVVLIAGKGHETYQILGSRRIDFDDREVARRALKQKCGEGSRNA